ncbi:hypothetical protein [Desulfosarcina ovata]|uniref:Uncharacterized protein n=1 Tax=Desulfosarcina ovata subsp. ovata TaxID=2752305 RepID=A0A5K8A367_9BACT|nr:hypothetical protein [Desulfosarcina ovata]BBO86985.1 hypothetical protein DSCOOX_01650 [Desulfosarcina ovata subsp. ovata]
MNDYLARFAAAPKSFKKSFAMLTVAWICHPIFLYSLFLNAPVVEGADKAIMKMAIVSISLLALLFLIKKWARALVVVGTLFVVINDLFYFALAPHNKIATLLCVVVVLLAITGTYQLFDKASRDYFTKLNPKTESQDPRGG